MAKKLRIPTQKGFNKTKSQEDEDAEFVKMLKSDVGTKILGDEKKMRKVLNETIKYLGLKL